MKQIQILTPAKINLFLKILNKREDGYHNIETVFEKVSLFDKIILKENSQNKIVVESNVKELCSSNNNNTVYKAIWLLKKKFKINKGVCAFIEKNIPIGAGLGGGSSDAAATLKGLNKLWKLGLNRKELLDLALDIGSDVPLFILDGSFLLGEGRGEKLSKIPVSKGLKLWHVLVVPDFKVSTPYAYSLFDQRYLNKGMGRESGILPGKLRLTIPGYSAKIITCALLNRDVSLLNYYSYNSFRTIVLKRFTRLFRLSKVIENISRDCVHLSGSGSALFMTFSDRKEAVYLVSKIKRLVGKCSIFIVHTC